MKGGIEKRDARIDIAAKVPQRVKDVLEARAQQMGYKNITSLVIDEILMDIYSNLVKCPECGWPAFDLRDVTWSAKTIQVECINCGHEWEWKNRNKIEK